MRKVIITAVIAVLAAGGLLLLYARAHKPLQIQGPVLAARFLNEDFGDAVVLTTPEGKVIVIDPAPRQADDDLVAMLRRTRVRQISVILSNPDSDAANALSTLQTGLRVTTVLRAELGRSAGLWKAALTRARCQPVAETVLSRGDLIKLSPTVRLETLCPEVSPSSPNARQDGLVFRIVYRDKSILFASQISASSEAELIGCNSNLRNSVLAENCQANQDNPSLELLSVVRPEVCVISSDRPVVRIVERLNPQNTGAALYETGKDGIIEIDTDGRSIQVISGSRP